MWNVSPQTGSFLFKEWYGWCGVLLEVCHNKTNQSCLYFWALPVFAPQSCSNQAAHNYPTTIQRCSKLLPRHNAPGERWVLIKRQSQGSSQVSLQCLPTALPDLYRQLSLLIKHIRPVTLVKPILFGAVQHASLNLPRIWSSTWICRSDLSQRSEWHYLCFKWFSGTRV